MFVLRRRFSTVRRASAHVKRPLRAELAERLMIIVNDVQLALRRCPAGPWPQSGRRAARGVQIANECREFFVVQEVAAA